VINSNLDLISHRLATIHPLRTTTDGRQTDDRQQPYHLAQPLRKYGWLKYQWTILHCWSR